MNNPFEFFDAIFVINLDINIDRWNCFRKEAEKMGFLHLVERIPAIYNEIGSFGCAHSHKKCLEIAKSRGLKNVLIFEDDVKFIYNRDYVWTILNKCLLDLKEKPWDLFYLGINLPESNKHINTNNNNLIDISNIGKFYGRFGVVFNCTVFDVYEEIPNDIEQFNPKIHRGDMYLSIRDNIIKLGCNPMLVVVHEYPSFTGYMADKTGMQPKIKIYDSNILLSYVKYNMFNISEWSKNKNIYISANMASFPLRIKEFERAVYSIIPNVDILRIYLNEYVDIPEFLINDKIKIFRGDDIKDTGKYIGLSETKHNEIFFSVDDDFEYSTLYFVKHIQFLEEHDYSILLSTHGRKLKDLNKYPYQYENCEKMSSCTKNNDFDLDVDIIGTGVMCFKPSIINLTFDEFSGCSGMTDIHVSRFARKNNIKMFARKHTSDEIVNLIFDPKSESYKKSLWEQQFNDYAFRERIMYFFNNQK